MDIATRSADWLGEVIDLMREPATSMPVPALLTLLGRAFGISGCSWNWFDADGSFGVMMEPAEVPLNERETLDLWLTGDLFDSHPLVQWFKLTGDLRPQTIARVPTMVVPRRRRLPIERSLTRIGIEHQLSIVYRQNEATHRAFVLSRSRSDFSDDDLAVSRVVQRSLMALEHQIAVVQRMMGARTGADLGLTGRELAVLQLIAEGATTRHAARALACSPRTLQKHLQNVYRRLGVHDRLNAIRILRVAGVLGADPVADHSAVVGQGVYRGPVASVAGEDARNYFW